MTPGESSGGSNDRLSQAPSSCFTKGTSPWFVSAPWNNCSTNSPRSILVWSFLNLENCSPGHVPPLWKLLECTEGRAKLGNHGPVLRCPCGGIAGAAGRDRRPSAERPESRRSLIEVEASF